MISPETRALIRRYFFAEHWRIGTIAAELGVHPDTVRHAIESERFRSAPPMRASLAEPYLAFVRQTLEQHPRLRATRIHAMLRDRGYSGSVVQLRRAVARLRPQKCEPFLQLHILPGEQAQVDWAHFGHVLVGRAKRALSCFVMTLSYSRALYLEFFFDQTMENFLRGHVNGFAAWGGQPRVILYDNLKSVVLERRGDQIQFHPRLLELSGHYLFSARPCQVRAGNQKGRVERAIRYVRDSFWAGRVFTTLAECNRQAWLWRDQIAHQRRWPGGDHRIVAEAFQEEQPRLLPPAQHPFPTDRIVPVQARKTIYIRFDLNDYSIPHDRTQRTLTVLADLDTVRIAEKNEVIATHVRTWDRGQQVEQLEHLARLVAEKKRARQHRGLDRLSKAAPSSQAFIRCLAERNENIGSNTSRLLQLLDAAGADALEDALVEVLERDTIHIGAVRQVIDRQRSERGLPLPLTIPLTSSEHSDLVVTPHPLATYDALKKDQDQ